LVGRLPISDGDETMLLVDNPESRRSDMTNSSVMNARAHPTPLETGIGVADRALLIDGLASVLGDCYVLQFKTCVASWNVVGPLFLGLHDLMAAQGDDLFAAVDSLAKRTRALDYPAPERLSALVERSDLDEEAGVVRGTAHDMINQLARDHEAIARNVRTVAKWAEQMKDQVTFNLLTDRLQKHEEAVWRLRALLA
jgi:starvation-inducible DNA-binding protein